jgi:MFS transporter, DHA1 family, tetracycline resistance protein
VLFFVFVTVFLDMIGFGLVIPLLPFYVKSMGGTAETVGGLLACFSFTQLLATPLLGRLSDRYGRRPVILVSLAGNAVAMVIFALATHTALLPVLFLSRLLAGATAGNLAACQASIADVTEGEWRAKGMGWLGAGIGLGMVAGPVLGGLLNRIGPWAPPLTAASMAAIALVAAFFRLPETPTPLRKRRADEESGEAATDAPPVSARAATVRSLLSRWAIVSVLLLYFFTFLALTNLQVALALLTERRLGWGPAEVGHMFGLVGIIMMIIQGGLIGRLVRVFGETRLITAGSVFIGLGMSLIAGADSAAPLVGGTAIMAAGFGLTNPLLGSIASSRAGNAHRGAVLGFAQSAGGLARTVGPLWGGFLFTRVAPGAPFVSGAVAAGFSFLIALGVNRASGSTAPARG